MAQTPLQVYKPRPVPDEVQQLPSYLSQELSRLSIILNQGGNDVFHQQYAAPSKVTDGQILLADGVTWNPAGTGKGFVFYKASDKSWHAFNSASEIKYTNGSGQTVEDLYINGITANQITATSIAVGAVTATAISVTQLSAITSDMGTLTVGKLQDATGKYSIDLTNLLETIKDTIGTTRIQVGNYTGTNYGIRVYSAVGALIFDSVVGLYSAGVSPDISTAQITDGAGLGNSAVWPISLLPITVAGFGIVDAMVDPGPTTEDGQIFYRNLDGTQGWKTQYGNEINQGTWIPLTANKTLTGSMVDIGTPITIPNPGVGPVYVEVDGVAGFSTSATTCAGFFQLMISFNGGSTWNTSPNLMGIQPSVTATGFPTGPLFFGLVGTPTGDIQIKMQAESQGTGTVTLRANLTQMTFKVCPPNSNFNFGPLAASLPATDSITCNGTFPATTCTYNKGETVTITGGITPLIISNTVSAGTGSITSGSSTQAFVVSDTETTSDGGTTHTTTVSSTVTSSESYTGVTFASTLHTATATITAGHTIPVGALLNITGASNTGYNGTNLVVLSVTATTFTYTIAGSSIGAATGGTVNNVHVITGNLVITGTFKRIYSAVSVSVSTIGGSHFCLSSNCATIGCVCSFTGTGTATISGGDGSYTKSWTVTAGSANITSGATALTVHVSDSTSTSSTSTLKCAVTDGHSKTGNASKGITFNCSCNDNR